MTPDFPRITKWLAESDLDEKHAAYDFKFSDPIAPAFEYFLGLEEVPGFKEKLAEIRTSCAGQPNRNDHLVSWAAFCAELGAIHLLGGQLGLPILGLDQSSPRAPTRNCDVKAEVDGQPKYFEVKRKSSEDCQTAPHLLTDSLLSLDLPYQLSTEPGKEGYDCNGLDEHLVRLNEHVRFFRHHEDRDLWLQGDTVPPVFTSPGFSVWFREGEPEGGIAEFFEPMTGDEIRSWLLEEGHPGRDGEPMVPKVRQARNQGADYLMCRVDPGGPWTDLVGNVFKFSCPSNSRAATVDDPALDGLHGIILFSRYDNFFIINSAAADHALL
jgi:hypothetical protein